MNQKLQEISNYFFPNVKLSKIDEINRGRINKTYILHYDEHPLQITKVVAQRINASVFAKPSYIDTNIALITPYLKEDAEVKDYLAPYATPDGKTLLELANEHNETEYWRLYNYLDGYTTDSPSDYEQLTNIGYIIGRFNSALAGVDASLLKEVIPAFHNTAERWQTFQAKKQIAAKKEPERLQEASEIIDFLELLAPFYPIVQNCLDNGTIPLRVTHNDTKTNNIMLDAQTKKAKCMIDYDTVMPGFIGNDVADAMRGMVDEAEKDTEKVYFYKEYCAAFMKGYAKATSTILTKEEIALLPLIIVVMDAEQCMRFLGEYITKGNYYGNAEKGKMDLELSVNQYLLTKSAYELWQAEGGIEAIIFEEYAKLTDVAADEYRKIAKALGASK